MPRSSLHSPLLQAALRRPTTTTNTAARPFLLRHIVPPTRTTTRTMTHLPALRPTTLRTSTSSTSFIFRAANGQSTTPVQQRAAPHPTAAGSGGAGGDVVAKQSISAHPALAGFGAQQIRCGPRPTMSGATRLVQKRRHGFLSRIRCRAGRNTLARRRAKGRKRLSA